MNPTPAFRSPIPRLPVAAVFLWTVLCSLVGPLSAQNESPAKKLTVGTKVIAPFAFKDPEGRWQGISIDLWRRIATRIGVEFEFVERPLSGLLDGLQKKELDVVAAALTVTPEREATIDFSHPFHPSGLGIAVPLTATGGILAAGRALLSWNFLQGVGALFLLILVVGVVIWLFERRRNAAQFGGTTVEGVASGFWWSAVTMTTVGYGDKAPVTLGGRVIGLIWMFAAIITISGFTAAIASSLTLSQLDSSIKGPGDLAHVQRVVTVADSTSARYLQAARVSASAVPNPERALELIASGRADAAVYDAPILRFEVGRRFADSVVVLPAVFERQDYAMGLPLESPLRKDINRALLAELKDPGWQDVLFKYLGRD